MEYALMGILLGAADLSCVTDFLDFAVLGKHKELLTKKLPIYLTI